MGRAGVANRTIGRDFANGVADPPTANARSVVFAFTANGCRVVLRESREIPALQAHPALKNTRIAGRAIANTLVDAVRPSHFPAALITMLWHEAVAHRSTAIVLRCSRASMRMIVCRTRGLGMSLCGFRVREMRFPGSVLTSVAIASGVG